MDSPARDPVLFSGTLRSNLGPNEKYTDAEIWTALNDSLLAKFVRSKNEGLDFKIDEGGENLCAGQRQLICLARALLRRETKILVLDEATASLDADTDKCIQKAIRENFHCTVLTIAHRINTIMDYDKILVMNGGEVAELNTPEILKQNPESLFSALVKESGIDV